MNQVYAGASLARLLDHGADAVAAVKAGRSLDDVLSALPGDVRPGAQAIAFEALRGLGAAEAARRRLAPRQPPQGVDALLLCALALLWPRPRPLYPDHTLVDQAVAAARRRAAASAGFVNAVLRRFVREREAIVGALAADEVARWNHPRWWLDRLRRDWPAQAESILRADNERAPMTLRVNARRTDAPACTAALAAAGIGARAVPVPGCAQPALQLDEPRPVLQLPGFAEGLISVQDAAAQRAAPLLLGEGLRPGARVLDACAAPGGKTAHLLELAELDLLALDLDPERTVRVRETLDRLGLQAQGRVEVLAADAGQPAAWWDGRPFDAILLDAPCSASGIVRRHPDIRWLRRDADIGALAARQAQLLKALWPLLAEGGRLLFATCSVFKAEGQDVIDAFLQRQPPGAVSLGAQAPGHLLPLPQNEAFTTADPGPAHADGFFYALLTKSRNT